MQELENYKKEKLTIDLVWANVFGILILIPIFFGSTIQNYVSEAKECRYNKKMQLEKGTLYTFHYLDVQSNMKSSIDTDDYFFGVKISPNRIVIAVLYNGHDDYNQLNYSLMTKNNPRHITLVSSKRKQYQLDHTYEKGVTHIFVDKDKIRSISKGYSDVFFIKVEL